MGVLPPCPPTKGLILWKSNQGQEGARVAATLSAVACSTRTFFLALLKGAGGWLLARGVGTKSPQTKKRECLRGKRW